MLEMRIDDPASIDRRHIQSVIAKRSKAIVQFSEKIYEKTALRKLNALCAEWGRKFEVRFYGHYGDVFDATALRYLPDVQALSVDCLMEAENLDALSDLAHLIELSLGIYRLDAPKFLEKVQLQNVERLALSETAKKNLDLQPLQSCRKLKAVYVVGHAKGIETLSTLSSLQMVSLAQIPNKQSLRFVSAIPALQELRIILGGRTDIHEVQSPSLEKLEIIRVRGFESLENLEFCPNLRELKVEDQIRLKTITFKNESSMLGVIKLLNCKTLTELRGLKNLQNLSHVRIYKTSIELEQLIYSGLPPRLKIFAMYTGKSKEDEKLRRRLDGLGYSES